MMHGGVVSDLSYSAHERFHHVRSAAGRPKPCPAPLLDAVGCSHRHFVPLGQRLSPLRAVLCRDAHETMLHEVESRSYDCVHEYSRRTRAAPALPRAPPALLLDVAGCSGGYFASPSWLRAPAKALLCRDAHKMMLGEAVSQNFYSASEGLHDA